MIRRQSGSTARVCGEVGVEVETSTTYVQQEFTYDCGCHLAGTSPTPTLFVIQHAIDSVRLRGGALMIVRKFGDLSKQIAIAHWIDSEKVPVKFSRKPGKSPQSDLAAQHAAATLWLSLRHESG